MAGSIWDKPFTTPGAQAPLASSNVFFNPQSTYGADRNWNQTPLAGTIREQNPNLAYAQYGQGLGIGDNDTAFNRWFYQQFPRFQNAQGMAILQNPLMTIDQFMRTLPGLQQLQQQYQSMSPTARGLNFNANAPQVRWIGR
jgi:hypothetical protein